VKHVGNRGTWKASGSRRRANAVHERLDGELWDNIYVVGDVHGCPDELDEPLEAVSPTGEEPLVFVGDFVNNVPDGEAVLEIRPAFPEEGIHVVDHDDKDPTTFWTPLSETRQTDG
jgi:hypothetical protein